MYQEGTSGTMKTPEIYMKVDIRELSLTDKKYMDREVKEHI
jgi:hypothetical protein|tara:strand:- start:22 stop:144 length:123 start_codon:yes stop_codon:yes gene_type:complete